MSQNLIKFWPTQQFKFYGAKKWYKTRVEKIGGRNHLIILLVLSFTTGGVIMADNNIIILVGPYTVMELHEVPPMNCIPRGKFVDGLLNETAP